MAQLLILHEGVKQTYDNLKPFSKRCYLDIANTKVTFWSGQVFNNTSMQWTDPYTKQVHSIVVHKQQSVLYLIHLGSFIICIVLLNKACFPPKGHY